MSYELSKEEQKQVDGLINTLFEEAAKVESKAELSKEQKEQLDTLIDILFNEADEELGLNESKEMAIAVMEYVKGKVNNTDIQSKEVQEHIRKEVNNTDVRQTF